ncbi:MAG: hypothetical protein OXN27_16065 [Candidatus Poribacteria bacterium]|nr:hypothetical protein [Candidatus Poribacteria bacterium]
MKTIFFFSILFYAIALPALGELMPQDLDKIRLIVKEEIKAEITELKREIKEDIANSEKNMKEYINIKVDSVNTKVGSKVDGVNIKVDSVEEKITFLSYLVYALIALIVGAIAIPQLIMAWRSGRDRSLEKQVERLTQEMETLKQQIVKP